MSNTADCVIIRPQGRVITLTRVSVITHPWGRIITQSAACSQQLPTDLTHMFGQLLSYSCDILPAEYQHFYSTCL